MVELVYINYSELGLLLLHWSGVITVTLELGTNIVIYIHLIKAFCESKFEVRLK